MVRPTAVRAPGLWENTVNMKRGQQTGRENVEGQELFSYESLSLPELFGGEIFSHVAV